MRTFARVGDIAEQIRGVTYSKADASSAPTLGKVPVLRAGNIEAGELTFSDLVYVPADKVKTNQYVRENDVLIAASSGSRDVVGKSARSRREFAGGFGAFLKVLRPSPHVDPSYFAHYFRTPSYRRRIATLASGANINNIRNEHLSNLQIPLPPLDEQCRIADILDRADAIRTKRREVLAHLDSLTQSIFHDMFGGSEPDSQRIVSLGEVVPQIDNGSSPKCETRAAALTEPGVLKLGAVTYGVFRSEENKAYLHGSLSPTHEVLPGDVLMTRKNTRDLVGAVALVDTVRSGLYLPDLIFRLHLDRSQVDPTYFHSLMMSTAKRQEVRRLASGSAASMPNISKARLRNLPLELPPLAMQQAFAARLQLVDAQRTAVERVLTADDELFASLQSRAFRGEL